MLQETSEITQTFEVAKKFSVYPLGREKKTNTTLVQKL